jgi:hypothetical protein
MIETLPGSTLPAELRAAGYDVRKDGEGERILASAIVQEFTLTSSGAYEPLTEGSTKSIAHRVRHAGIYRYCATPSPWNDPGRQRRPFGVERKC